MPDFPRIDIGGAEIRPEWKALDAVPKYPKCPLVIDIDLATDVLEQAAESNLAHDHLLPVRFDAINFRRIVIARAQEVQGCQGICDQSAVLEVGEDSDSSLVLDQDTLVSIQPTSGQTPAPLACGLTTGRIEHNAIGNMGDILENFVKGEARQIGF